MEHVGLVPSLSRWQAWGFWVVRGTELRVLEEVLNVETCVYLT